MTLSAPTVILEGGKEHDDDDAGAVDAPASAALRRRDLTVGRPPGSVRGSWEAFRRLVFATYGDTCYICGHGGARTVDHVTSVTERPDLSYAIGNCRPAHGTRNRCRQCGQCCNQLKGGYSLERARRLIAERAPAAAPPRPEPVPADAGRDW